MLNINRDHRACLVSSNRENFHILTVRQYDTFLYAGEIRGASSGSGLCAGTLRGQLNDLPQQNSQPSFTALCCTVKRGMSSNGLFSF